MGPRKVSRTPKKLNKKFNKTRSTKQRGSGTGRSRHIAPEDQNDPNDPNINDYLGLALEEGRTDNVEKYLKVGADPNMTINDTIQNEDVPAIIYAARHNTSSGIIENLLKAGANVEQEPYYISTPLIEAAQSGNLQAVRVLLDNKANINAKTHMGTPPIAYAIINDDINMIKLMLEKRKGEIDLNDIRHELDELDKLDKLELANYPNNQEIKKILKTYISSEEKTNQSGSGRKRTRKYKKSNNKTLKK
jgi:ankyrin repeat protein